MGVIFMAAPARAANVDNLTLTNFDVSYKLSRDEDGRSVLRTTEAITAEFPSSDQNHGIERYIPHSYDGHSIGLEIDSIRDQSGKSWNYQTSTNGEYTALRIGDGDTYLHGQHTFILTYTQRDVTKNFGNTGADEFYWDVNGTAWRVPISKLTTRLEIDQSLVGSLTGKSACYVGQYESSDRCELSQDGAVFTSTAENLSSGDNQSIAVGFKTGTFAAYEMSLFEKILSIWMIIQGILMAVSVALIIILTYRFNSSSKRKKEIGTIVPEYLPPSDSSVSLSGTLITTNSSFAAQIIDLAVRHYIRIYELSEAKLWSTAKYQLEIIKPIDDLREEEKEFVRDIFSVVEVGTTIDTDSMKKDITLSTRLLDNPTKIKDLKRSNYGIQEKRPDMSAWFKRFGYTTLVFGIVLFSPPLFFVSIVAFIMGATLWVLTDKGLAMSRYLEGLKLYISVAEQDRLRMLQSPEGAQKVQTDTSDPKMLVKLYERVLPYAVLFGQEKQWNKQLGDLYQSTSGQPDWYSGANMAAFNAAAFSSAMSNLTTSINSSGASYSSSGGSGGGGFSGGGGGGGGGGGW